MKQQPEEIEDFQTVKNIEIKSKNISNPLLLRVTDIPGNLRLVLKNGKQSSLVYMAIKKCGSAKHLSQMLDVDSTTIYKWKWEGSFMKFKYLKKILSFLGMEPKEISEFVIGVKGESSIIAFFKSKLPFKIPIELVAHLQGDGSVSQRDRRCSYKNTELFLIDSFINTTSSVFRTKIYTNRNEIQRHVYELIRKGKIYRIKDGERYCFM